MKHTKSILFRLASMLCMMLALGLNIACSSDNDNGSDNGGGGNNKPLPFGDTAWAINFQLPEGDIEGCPNWQETNFFDFENTMTAIICFDTAMDGLISDDDRMAAIIDGEVRDIGYIVTYRQQPVFMLLIPFESDDDKVELQYYNAKTNQTYIMTDAFSVWDDTVGSEETNLFYLELIPKTYLVLTLPDDLPFMPSPDDEMGIFCGDECCGLPVAIDRKNWEGDAYMLPQLTGTKAHVRYYSAEKGVIYTTDDIIDLTSPNDGYNLKFKELR